MMKLSHSLCRGLGLCVFFLALTTSCVNHIAEEDENVINDGDIPFRFVANIQEVVNTRMAGNNFEEGDEVGLFALAGSTTMKEERYADNLLFVRSSDGEFVADEAVYYPDDGVTLNLISYFPYRKDAVAMGESAMQVEVSTKQDMPANYAHSDFLIATKENVLAAKEAISLTYKHKFFKLKIALDPSEGEEIETLLAADPQLSVNGFYTKTGYDFQKDSYSGYSEEKGIIPAGEWKIEEGRLIGKELILVPQEVKMGYQYVTIEVGGRTYSSLLPSTLKVENSKQRELEIAFKSDEDILMSKVIGDIEDWGDTEKDHAQSEIVHKYIDVSKLTFEQSNVYKVLHAGQQVAEICKEYLVTPDLSSQAIVAYPMKADGPTVDLSKGVVVQLLGQSGKVHGGGVSWNMENKTLTYTPGTLTARNNVYVLADGQISLSKAVADEVQTVWALSDMIRDARGGVIHHYPMVKIGTQYWMRDDLMASLYNDGEEIPQLDEMAEGAVGHLLSTSGNYFYSSEAVLTHKLQPDGWSVPGWKDWNLLKSYLREDASLLKAGTWRLMKDETILAESNNRSGFGAVPVGVWMGVYAATEYEGRYLGYWTLDETGSTISKIFLLKSNNNDMAEGEPGVDKAFSIRCIRK